MKRSLANTLQRYTQRRQSATEGIPPNAEEGQGYPAK